MKDIYAITVSTKYDDILGVVIHHNVRFFKKWYIITDPADTATIELVNTANYPNIELLYYNFYENAAFDFGGARRYGQLHSIEQNGVGKYTLMLDSDIYLPDNFADIIERHTICENTIYGIQHRHDFARLSDLHSRKGYTIFHEAACIYGFFQFFIQTHTTLYNHSYDCSQTDLEFHDRFAKKGLLPLLVYHLGKSFTHWQGRKNKTDFIRDV